MDEKNFKPLSSSSFQSSESSLSATTLSNNSSAKQTHTRKSSKAAAQPSGRHHLALVIEIGVIWAMLVIEEANSSSRGRRGSSSSRRIHTKMLSRAKATNLFISRTITPPYAPTCSLNGICLAAGREARTLGRSLLALTHFGHCCFTIASCCPSCRPKLSRRSRSRAAASHRPSGSACFLRNRSRRYAAPLLIPSQGLCHACAPGFLSRRSRRCGVAQCALDLCVSLVDPELLQPKKM